jgi:hypothetical protein
MTLDWHQIAGLAGIDDRPLAKGERLEFVLMGNDEEPTGGWDMVQRGMHNTIWSRYVSGT